MKSFILFFISFFSFTTFAQSDFAVISFKKLDDYDAQINFPKEDNNGKKAAIIKVVTKEKNFAFENGQLGIVEVIPKTGEIWIYIPEGSRRFDIKHPKFGVIRYALGEKIISGKSYELVLKTPTISNSELLGTGKVRLNIFPQNSKFYFGTLELANTNNEFEYLGGNHKIKIENEGYISIDTIISVIPNEVNEFSFSLKPNWANLSIKAEPNGSSIYINDEFEGYNLVDRSGKANGLKPGNHLIKIQNENYYSKVEAISLLAGQTEKLSYSLLPIEGAIKVNSKPNGSMVLLNSKALGKTPLEIKHIIGKFDLSIEKKGYLTKTKSIIVKENEIVDINVNLVNYRKATLPLKFAKATTFSVMVAAAFGGAYSLVLANNYMKEYKNSNDIYEVIKLRENVVKYDTYSIIGGSTVVLFSVPYILFSRKLKKKKSEYGIQ